MVIVYSTNKLIAAQTQRTQYTCTEKETLSLLEGTDYNKDNSYNEKMTKLKIQKLLELVESNVKLKIFLYKLYSRNIYKIKEPSHTCGL